MTDEQQPTVLILYGGTGDLAKRMVLPAIYELYSRGLLPEKWKLVGNGRGDVAHEDFQAHIKESLEEFATAPDEEEWKGFAANVLFAGGGFTSDDPGSLLSVIEEAKKDLGDDPQIIHYLAIPPKTFEQTTKAIKEHQLNQGVKAVYEKPYGTSLQSFEELDALVHTTFDEEQIYRIDHFLGKEATQNLHMLRFANDIFADTWNRDHVVEVQIDVPETLDIADRAGFYDATGAALDMLVTHLFQVAAEVAMDPPESFDAEALQAARESVIAHFRPLSPREVVLGQYASYLDTEGIPKDSTTDTFVAARLWIDSDRWQGVPFLLRTGKKLATKAQRVSLIFKKAAGPLANTQCQPGVLTFDLSGTGAIEMEMVVKKPGPDFVPADAANVLHLNTVSEGSMQPYTALIHDVFVGDRSLFTSAPGLRHAFEAFAPLQSDDRPAVQVYDDDSWGPDAASALAGQYGWLLDRTKPKA
ncbi:MAG: glucose-6-phosphate dehydrogenase [Propionibacteriaceae bacterium]